jgi:hypothetical protein
MLVKCPNCLPKEGINVRELSPNEKKILIDLTNQLRLFNTKYLKDSLSFNHRDAKFIAAHINLKKGLCCNCNFEQLENVNCYCPKCGSFNFNWDESEI